MLTTSLVKLWRIRLDPAPDAAGIYRYAPFRYDLGDMLVSQRIAKVPSHAQKNQLARVLASLERVGWRDRHEIPSLPNLVPKLRNGTHNTTISWSKCRPLNSSSTVNSSSTGTNRGICPSSPTQLLFAPEPPGARRGDYEGSAAPTKAAGDARAQN